MYFIAGNGMQNKAGLAELAEREATGNRRASERVFNLELWKCSHLNFYFSQRARSRFPCITIRVFAVLELRRRWLSKFSSLELLTCWLRALEEFHERSLPPFLPQPWLKY